MLGCSHNRFLVLFPNVPRMTSRMTTMMMLKMIKIMAMLVHTRTRASSNLFAPTAR